MLSYFKDWRLKINKNKSEAILFTRKLKYINIKLDNGGYDLKWQPSMRYLGATLDRRANWTLHIKFAREKGSWPEKSFGL